MTGPLPSAWSPSVRLLMPGASVAWVTSTTIATSGSSAKAAVIAPCRPTSSCAAATATKRPIRAAGLGDQPRGLERHPGAEAVVHRARRVAPVGQLDRLAGDDRDVADAHAAARVLAVAGADVDVQVLELRRLLALVGLEQVDRLLADDAGDAPVARRDLDALPDEDHRVPAADRPEPQQALVVDVGDDQADLVDVADDRHERPRPGAGHARHRVAHDVAGDLGGEARARPRATWPRRPSRPRRGRTSVSRARSVSGSATTRRRGRGAGAGRTAGSRRGGSTPPPSACRCARAP